MHKPLTDTHAHLTYIEDAEILKALDTAYADSNALIIDPGVDYNDFQARYERLKSYSWVRLAAGIWPDEYPLNNQKLALEALEHALQHPACKFLGESGLDYYWMKAEPNVQKKLFMSQLELAVAYKKPVIVHSRDAWVDTLQCLELVKKSVPVIIHCFSYGLDELNVLVKNNYYVSFSGNITYKRMQQVVKNLSNVPLELLLLETDTPYQNPEPYRGKPSSPFDIVRTYEAVASNLQVSIEELQNSVTNTIKHLLNEQ